LLLSIIKRLPIHPPPIYEKTVGEWIESLAEANLTPFKVMFFYITKTAKNIGFINALMKLTEFSRWIIIKLENKFKTDYWEKKRVCPIIGCKFRKKDNHYLFEHIENVHNLGSGWYQCLICDFKTKLIKDLETHLNKSHNRFEIQKYNKND